MTQPEYTGADRACDCSPPNICDILAELQAMKDRIENMIVSVQGLPGDHAGNVQLPFSEDIADSTLGVSGTFAGGHAVLQVKDIADNADETARNAQDIAQIAADAANSASQSASGALAAAQTADSKAEQASADAGLALAAAEDAQAAVGNSVMGIGPSVAEETQVRVPYTLKDGTQGAFLVPAVDPDSAGVITPGQMADLGHQLDSLGGEIDGVKAEYLKRHSIHEEQDITGRVAFKISPFVPVLKPNEYADHNGTRAYNPASAAADPALFHTVGNEKGKGTKESNGWTANFYQADTVLHDTDVQLVPIKVTDKNNEIIVGMFAGTYRNGAARGGLSVSNTTDKGKQVTFLYITTQNDGTTTLSLVCPGIGKSQEIARLTPDP